MINIDLSGKTALVTGGNIGIGRAIALILAEAGADVAITYLTHADDSTVNKIKQLGRKSLALPLDASNSAEVNKAVTAVAQEFDGHIDILVNNAGGLVKRLGVEEMSDEHWHKVIDINLTSAFYCTRAVLPYMNRGWGRIVNMSSVAAHNGGGNGSVAYATSKGAINSFTFGLAKELAPRGILVNAVAPGLILDTPFHETFTPPEAQRATIESIPLKRPGLPEDVAKLVLYLSSDLASFVTGDVAGINGGVYFA
ncbi:MAG TPA: SDR family NAD(P)-dependent oxidoreductase [Chloroflexia bacterium]|nr:SDR family NAD(P)-dependent oxidoreductase [Chloroflexia bacterium]